MILNTHDTDNYHSFQALAVVKCATLSCQTLLWLQNCFHCFPRASSRDFVIQE